MNMESAKDALWSICHLHNESGNIWSHIFGFVAVYCDVDDFSLCFAHVCASFSLAMMVYLTYDALTNWLEGPLDIALFVAYAVGQSLQVCCKTWR